MWTRLVLWCADSLPSSVGDELMMVVPSNLCAPLIGRGGVVMKKMNVESGAHAHVQSEEEMRQMGHFFGRTIHLSGTYRQRCHAMYLLLKQVRGAECSSVICEFAVKCSGSQIYVYYGI